MTIPEISTVCFVGAGTMGCYNAMAAAISGYRAVLYDVSEASLEKVEVTLSEMAAFLVGGAYCPADDIPAAMERVSVNGDLSAATASADLVSESVFECLDIKRDIHRQLDAVCPARTILTTNSSALCVSEIEDVVARGAQFAALHTHLGSPLVDIVGGPRTDAGVIAILERYVHSTGGVPLLLKKEYPGYVLNAMLGPLLGTALALRLREGMSVEQIDAAWIAGQAAPMGPFGMMDLFGLGLIRDSWVHRDRRDALQAIKDEVLALLVPMVERGELGMKSGAGFYRYPAPTYQQPGFADSPPDAAVYRALLVALISNAILLADEDVAEPGDIDRAWQVGTFLSHGPFQLLETMGVGSFLSALESAVAAQRVAPSMASRVQRWLESSSTKTGPA
jgi:3-hydroxybutyryl-CoA dehydrogenase